MNVGEEAAVKRRAAWLFGGVALTALLAQSAVAGPSVFPTGVTLVAIGCLNSTPPPAIDYGPSPLADIAINP